MSKSKLKSILKCYKDLRFWNCDQIIKITSIKFYIILCFSAGAKNFAFIQTVSGKIFQNI